MGYPELVNPTLPGFSEYVRDFGYPFIIALGRSANTLLQMMSLRKSDIYQYGFIDYKNTFYGSKADIRGILMPILEKHNSTELYFLDDYVRSEGKILWVRDAVYGSLKVRSQFLVMAGKYTYYSAITHVYGHNPSLVDSMHSYFYSNES